jgi:hypothetical protein
VATASLEWSTSGSGGSAIPAGKSVTIYPDVVREHLTNLRGHATTMRDHSTRFQQAVQALGL